MSGACEILTAQAASGVSPALRAVDCLAGESVASAFARLFGSSAGGGALLPALTIGLTLYVGFFAISLLTGRSRLGLAALTPRALALGLVLTFATSWIAYSQVVWNLATGAPDEIASVLTGGQGSATQVFGDRIDLVFSAIAEAADAQQGVKAPGTAAAGNFTPTNLMWLGALLLLLGTVGVLVTARIALAVLLAVGPVFIVLALFSGTRGLFVGWLRGVVLTAVVPLFVVVGGGLVLELLVPVIASLRGIEGVDGRAALALFVIACVHVALMAMVVRVAGTIVSGWRVFGLAEGRGEGRDAAPSFSPPPAVRSLHTALSVTPRPSVIAGAGLEVVAASAPDGTATASRSRTHIAPIAGSASAERAVQPRGRARGIGSRFAAPHRAGGLHR